MQRILWGRDTSSNVMKVIWALEELGLPYDRRDVGGKFGQTDTPAYRAMNPTGLVPTLQEDDFTLWESNAVCRYLCHAYAPRSALWPADARARAHIDRWMDAQQTVLNRPAGVVFWGLVRTPADKRDQAAIAQGVVDAAAAYGLIGAELSRHAFVAGDDFTLADIPWGVHVHRWFSMAFERPEVPGLRAWYERLLERPAYRAHVARALE
ncbi:MAG: glutathione S-transferase family protein [Acetobacteraceae bacterium]